MILTIAYKSFLRLLANHCIIPALRMNLFKMSGVKIGKKVFVNMDVKFVDDWKSGAITLEDEVSVATNAVFVASSNPNNSFLGRDYDVVKTAPIRIKRGSWIGAGAVIMPGITIGEGAIVGANAVVTHDVPDLTIVGGVPARTIRSLK